MSRESMRRGKMAPAGLETVSVSDELARALRQLLAESVPSDAADDATFRELAWLVEVWGSLPDDVRADVLTTVSAALPETVAGPS